MDAKTNRAHDVVMSAHGVAEAESHLSDLIDRAIQGEPVVIKRHGAPVVELRPLALNAEARRIAPMSKADMDWLVRRRVKPLSPFSAAEMVSQMRDEDDERLFRR